jgi:hypothetical protein
MIHDIEENANMLRTFGKDKLLYAKGFLEGLKAGDDLEKNEEAKDDG